MPIAFPTKISNFSKVALLKFFENAQKVEILLKTTKVLYLVKFRTHIEKKLKNKIQVAKWARSWQQHPDPVNFYPWPLKKTMLLVPSGLLKSLMQ